MAHLKLALLAWACATLLAHTASADTDTVLGGPIKCVKTNTSAACDELDECVWCIRTKTNSTVGTGCYPVKVADLLPRKFFVCDKPPTPSSSDDGIVAAATSAAVGLVAAVSSEVLPGNGDAVKCVKQNTSEACDELPSCTWCARTGNASDIGTGCYPLKAAVILPKQFFTCDEKPDAPPANANEAETSEEVSELHTAPGTDDGMSGFIKCVKQNTSEACDELPSCTWCARTGNASDIGTGCYPLKVAGILPKSFFECDVKPDAAPASALPEDEVAEAQIEAMEAGEEEAEEALEAVEVSNPSSPCDSKPQASCVAPECVWCTSAAVGGGCFTPDQAKKLPSAIFKCDSTPGAAAWRRFM